MLAARSEFEEAELLGREAIQLFEDSESPGGKGAVKLHLAKVLLMAGKSADAEHVAREALAFFERKGDRTAAEATRALIAEQQ